MCNWCTLMATRTSGRAAFAGGSLLLGVPGPLALKPVSSLGKTSRAGLWGWLSRAKPLFCCFHALWFWFCGCVFNIRTHWNVVGLNSCLPVSRFVVLPWKLPVPRRRAVGETPPLWGCGQVKMLTCKNMLYVACFLPKTLYACLKRYKI